MPDYLSIGSDDDFVRIPMGAPTAQWLADSFALRLPTKKLVDLVHAQADVRLVPQTMTPGAEMMSSEYFLEHDRRIEIGRAGRPLGLLPAGHKKDVGVSNVIRWKPGRVAIYGWHWASGKPIQPLSTVHEASYADYSHGIRFVAPVMEVDGHARSYDAVLADPGLARLLSDEGVIPVARYPAQ